MSEIQSFLTKLPNFFKELGKHLLHQQTDLHVATKMLTIVFQHSKIPTCEFWHLFQHQLTFHCGIYFFVRLA